MIGSKDEQLKDPLLRQPSSSRRSTNKEQRQLINPLYSSTRVGKTPSAKRPFESMVATVDRINLEVKRERRNSADMVILKDTTEKFNPYAMGTHQRRDTRKKKAEVL